MDFFSIRFSIKVCQQVHQYHQLYHPFNFGKDKSSDMFGEAMTNNNLDMAIKLGPVIHVTV